MSFFFLSRAQTWPGNCLIKLNVFNCHFKSPKAYNCLTVQVDEELCEQEEERPDTERECEPSLCQAGLVSSHR